jgi:hypothetical protein
MHFRSSRIVRLPAQNAATGWVNLGALGPMKIPQAVLPLSNRVLRDGSVFGLAGAKLNRQLFI